MRRRNVGIFDVLSIQGLKLPVGFLLLLCVFEGSNLSEDRYLLDELLQRSCVDRETAVCLGLLDASFLTFLQLLCPVDDHLF